MSKPKRETLRRIPRARGGNDLTANLMAIRCAPEMAADIRRAADEEGVAVSDLLRYLMSEYLAQREKGGT